MRAASRIVSIVIHQKQKVISVNQASRIQDAATVPAEWAGMRLDQAAAKLFPEYSRARLQTWIREGQLRMNGACHRPRDPVTADASLAVDAILERSEAWTANAGSLDLVFEDEHLLVVNKPPGLVVHPAAGHRDDTLVNRLLAVYPELAELPRSGVIHRLDKDTSGVMVVARSLPAHTALVAALQKRDVHRQYVVLVQGQVTGGGHVEAPIGRHPRQRKNMAVTPSGRPAVTHYRLRERLRAHSLLTCRLETGRTHQIRVHMAHIKHPVVGDPQYGGRNRLPAGAQPAVREALQAFRRQALHAEQLGFAHPSSGEMLEFNAPVPEDMTGLIELLREDTKNA